ncbi:MAG: thermonuclease family protein [Deltaproteobacteria bacterium]|nr:thermonuclease family protein [Deltaproteobacteria bacterium]
MSFRVTEVIDGDTFEVSPNWKWNNETGNIVRANGYNTPEEGKPGYQAAKDKLRELILNKDVELIKAVKITYGRLLCDVEYDGKNLADYFPQYK